MRTRLFATTLLVCAGPALAEQAAGNQEEAPATEPRLEMISVVAPRPRAFAANTVSEAMLAQQSPMTSVLAVVDNLPGVSIQEGDMFGSDDWSSSIAMRGFQVSLDEAQIGTTIDGFPNGTSDYWTGSKANRFIDIANLGGVTVSQGTADIASRSLEALGGTFDYRSADPARERGYTASVTGGEHDSERYSLRVDTGALFGTETHAWVSAIRQRSRDWMQGSVGSEREHAAAKVESLLGRILLTGMAVHDETDNASHQRIFSATEFREDPRWDRLIADWTDTPYVNQVYRPGWTIPRRNAFGYLKAELTGSASLSASAGVYFHRQRGRGDWLPPYLVDVIDDAGGSESEIRAGTAARGGTALGRLYFVGPDGVALAPAAGCASSLDFPYGGGGPEYDPACHPANAVPVQSYRHSHYGKDRLGWTLDAEWSHPLGDGENRLRAGLWYEDGERDLGRDWHRILDARAGPAHEDAPYWHQYEWRFPQTILKWHVEDAFETGSWTFSLGVRQYLVEVGREDAFGATPNLTVESDSDPLLSAGVVYTGPIAGLEFFAGYAENFKSLSDRLLEVPGRALDGLDPETAVNIDLGLRYAGRRASLTATYYDIDFDNRVFFLTPQTVTGPNYLIAGGGSYFNSGGLESRGVEVSATLRATDALSLHAALTWNDTAYLGTGDPLVSAAQGIVPGGDVVGIPERLAALSLDWISGRMTAGLSAKYTSERSVTPDGAWPADAYWLADAHLTYSLASFGAGAEGLELSLVVHNLFDETYLSTIATPGAFLGASRTASLTLTASL